jgi:hypothetical protein
MSALFSSSSSSFSVVRDTGRFGDVFFNVVDGDGWTIACYFEHEGGEEMARRHAETGRRQPSPITPSVEVLALFSR